MALMSFGKLFAVEIACLSHAMGFMIFIMMVYFRKEVQISVGDRLTTEMIE